MLRCGLLWYTGMDAVFLYLLVYGWTALPFSVSLNAANAHFAPSLPVSRLALRCAIGSRAGRLALQLSLTSRPDARLSVATPVLFARGCSGRLWVRLTASLDRVAADR